MLIRGICLGLLLAALEGCCNPACREETLPPERDRATPLRTVKLFQYALRHECMRLAYNCLTEADRGKVAYWKFNWFLCDQEFPGTDIGICDMIVEFVPDPPNEGGLEVRGPQAIVSGEARNTFLQVALVEVDGKWTVDGHETLRRNQ